MVTNSCQHANFDQIIKLKLLGGVQQKNRRQACPNFGPMAKNAPPPPKPPTLIKRVSICSEFKQLSACTVIMPNNAILVRASSCTDHLFSAQFQPKPLPKHFFTSVMQLMHNAMCKLQVWNQLLVICLNTPPRPT